MDNIFYTYIYLDPTNPGNFKYKDYKFKHEPFYVGEGQNKRYLNHLNENIEDNCNKYKIYKIKKIKRVSGLDPIIIKIKEGITKKQAQKLEIKLIKLIGRKDKGLGPLCNLTDGGDGTSGSIRTPEMIAHQSKTQIGRKPYYKYNEGVAETLRKTKRLVKLKEKILQYSLDGIFIKEWDNLQDIRDSYDSPSKIKRCCDSNAKNIYYRAGKSNLLVWAYHRIYNFIWIYDNNNNRSNIDTETRLINPIASYNNDNEVIYYKLKDLIKDNLNRNRFLSKFKHSDEITYNNLTYKIIKHHGK